YKMPIEGFAIGSLLASMATLLSYKYRLVNRHADFLAAKNGAEVYIATGRLLSLVKRGRHLYSCSIGMMIRGPICRLIIASTIGLQAAAVFDIAMRITQTVRD